MSGYREISKRPAKWEGRTFSVRRPGDEECVECDNCEAAHTWTCAVCDRAARLVGDDAPLPQATCDCGDGLWLVCPPRVYLQ